MPFVTRQRLSAGISLHAASRAAFAFALPAWRRCSHIGLIDCAGAFGACVGGSASHRSGVTLAAGSHVCRLTTVRSGFHKFPTQPMISPDSSLRMRTRIVPITINLCIREHFHRCSLQGNARKKNEEETAPQCAGPCLRYGAWQEGSPVRPSSPRAGAAGIAVPVAPAVPPRRPPCRRWRRWARRSSSPRPCRPRVSSRARRAMIRRAPLLTRTTWRYRSAGRTPTCRGCATRRR